MPTYQYQCTECNEALEAVQKFSDDALTECPNCGGRLRKVFSAVGVVFKGSGFYRTDSRGSVRRRSTEQPRAVARTASRRKASLPTSPPTAAVHRPARPGVRRPAARRPVRHQAARRLPERRARQLLRTAEDLTNPRRFHGGGSSCRWVPIRVIAMVQSSQWRAGGHRCHRRIRVLLLPRGRDRNHQSTPRTERPATPSSSVSSRAAGWRSCRGTDAVTISRRTGSTTAPTCGRCAPWAYARCSARARSAACARSTARAPCSCRTNGRPHQGARADVLRR